MIDQIHGLYPIQKIHQLYAARKMQLLIKVSFIFTSS